MSVVKAINKISDVVDKACSVILVALLAGMVITTSLQIICRVFFKALSWSEELTRYFLIWSTFIGASCVYKRSGHISVTFLQEKLSPKMQKVSKILVHLLCGAFFVIMVYYGFKYMGRQGNQLSAAMRIPMNRIYLAIPVGGIVMLLHAISAIINLLVEKEVEKQ